MKSMCERKIGFPEYLAEVSVFLEAFKMQGYWKCFLPKEKKTDSMAHWTLKCKIQYLVALILGYALQY